MATDDFQKLANTAMSAVAVFTKLYDGAAVAFRPTAIGGVIDCLKADQRIVLATVKQCPSVVCLAIGKKGSPDDQKIIGEFSIQTLTTEDLLRVMRENFSY